MQLTSLSLSICQGHRWTLLTLFLTRNIVLLVTLLQVVDYTTSYELASLSVFLHLICIDVVV